MQKANKIKIQFGESPQEDNSTELKKDLIGKDEATDNKVLDELMKIKDALRRDDIDTAMRCVDEAIKSQTEDVDSNEQKEPNLKMMLSEKLKGAEEPANLDDAKASAKIRFDKMLRKGN